MNPAVQPTPFFTMDIARAVETNTRKVRAAISRNPASATKIGRRWILTYLQAVATAIVLILRSIGFTWTEIPKALISGVYHYPLSEPVVQETYGYQKLLHYLAVTYFNMCVIIHGCGDSRCLEFWPEDQVSFAGAWHPMTLIPVWPIARVVTEVEEAKCLRQLPFCDDSVSYSNEMNRVAILESLKWASQLAADPRVATDHHRINELGHVLEDMVGFALEVAGDLAKNKNEKPGVQRIA